MSDKKGIAKHCEYLESKIRKKQSKIENLQQRIDKAIELINDEDRCRGTTETNIMLMNHFECELLSILKGEDKEC